MPKNDGLEKVSPFKHGVILGIYVRFQEGAYVRYATLPWRNHLHNLMQFIRLRRFAPKSAGQLDGQEVPGTLI